MKIPLTITEAEKAAFRDTSASTPNYPGSTSLAICNPDGSPISFNLNGAAITWNEVPSGTIDGNNKIYFLSNAPGMNKILLLLNGLAQQINVDFTISSNVITFNSAPQPGDTIWAIYSV
jgi:hypothetical protein